MSRKYPDFRSCPIPTFPPLGNWIKFGGVVKGMQLIKRRDYDQDPDLPPPSFNNLYTHPALPGLLFRRVDNISDLFRLGSSFIVGSRVGGSAGNTQGALVLAGRRAEFALEGNSFSSPPWASTTTSLSNNGDAIATAVINSLKDPKRFPLLQNPSPFGGAIQADDLSQNSGNSKLPGVAFAGVSDTRWSPTQAQASGYVFDGLYATTLLRSLAAGSPYIGDLAIMALLTDADDGCIALTSSMLSGSRPTKYLGNLTKSISLGTLGAALAPLKPQALSEAPSSLRSYISRAWDYELRLKKDVPLQAAVGAWWHSWAAVDRPNGGAGVSLDSGWIAPFVCTGENTSLSAYAAYGGPELFAPASPYWTIKPAEMSQASFNLMHCSICWADAQIVGCDLVPQAPTDRPPAVARETMSIHDIMVRRAKDMEAGFGAQRLGEIATAAGVVENAGTPSAQLVPTLDANFTCARSPFALYAEDPLTYGNAKLFREFYRRVYKRAEDLVRR